MKPAKNSIPLSILSALLILSVAANIAASPRPQVPVEKRRAMSKFDPTDLFPEARENGRKERTKREKNSAASILASNASSGGAESAATSRKNSRRRKAEAAQSSNSDTRLVANAPSATTPSPSSVPSATGATAGTPSNQAAPNPSPSLVAAQTSAPTSAATSAQSPSHGVMAGSAALTTPPAGTLIASANAAPIPDASSRKQPPGESLLSLPVLLTLISVVALALVFALIKLMKQFRGSIN